MPVRLHWLELQQRLHTTDLPVWSDAAVQPYLQFSAPSASSAAFADSSAWSVAAAAAASVTFADVFLSISF